MRRVVHNPVAIIPAMARRGWLIEISTMGIPPTRRWILLLVPFEHDVYDDGKAGKSPQTRFISLLLADDLQEKRRVRRGMNLNCINTEPVPAFQTTFESFGIGRVAKAPQNVTLVY